MTSIGSFKKKDFQKALEYLSANQNVTKMLVLNLNKDTNLIKTSWFDKNTSTSAIVNIKLDGISTNAEICIENIESLMNILKSAFHDDDKITLEETNSFLKISNGRVDYTARLSDKKHSEIYYEPIMSIKDGNIIQLKNMELKTYIKLNVDLIKEAIKNAGALQASKFGIMINNGLVYIVSTNDNDDVMRTTVNSLEGKGECEETFENSSIQKALVPLFGNLSIFMERDSPMVIYQKTDKVDLYYMFNPIRDV